MAFVPSVHGWPFPIVAAPHPSVQGLRASPDPDPGLGAGMCRVALDRYLAGVVIPRDTPPPSPGDALHVELVQAQTELGGLWTRSRRAQDLVQETSLDRAPLPLPARDGSSLASVTRSAWRQVRGSLERGEPALLALLGEEDGYARGDAAWPVLATAWSREGGRITLHLYDPARPGADDVRLSFARTGRLDARLTSGRRLRGFLHIPHERVGPAPLRAETFADRAVLSLNRKTDGGIAAVARGRRLDVVARDRVRSLLHFHRRPGGSWTSHNVTEQEGWKGLEVHGDPVAVASLGVVHAFARTYVGDLLHFRLLRGWSAVNRTDQKRAGPRFRLAGQPAAVAREHGAVSVLGRDQEGGLVHYHGGPLRFWSAEQVPGEPMAADPVALAPGGRLHVFGRTADHRVLHWELNGDRWLALDLTGAVQTGTALRIRGRPVPFLHDGTLHLFGVDPDDRLVQFHRKDAGRWTGGVLAEGVTGDPVVAIGPAGLHLFVAGAAGGLVHLRGDGAWLAEDVVASRPGLDVGSEAPADLLAWGSERELHLFGRWTDELISMSWTPETDWTAIPLLLRAGLGDRHQTRGAMVKVMDRKGHPHLFGVDGQGNVVHLERADWTEPGPRDLRKSRAPRRQAMTAGAPAAAPAAAPVEPAGPGEPVVTEPVVTEPVVETAPKFEWPEDPDERAGSDEPAAGPGVEPMDISQLESWPPPPPSMKRRREKKPG